jgi:hypothetical protein
MLVKFSFLSPFSSKHHTASCRDLFALGKNGVLLTIKQKEIGKCKYFKTPSCTGEYITINTDDPMCMVDVEANTGDMDQLEHWMYGSRNYLNRRARGLPTDQQASDAIVMLAFLSHMTLPNNSFFYIFNADADFVPASYMKNVVTYLHKDTNIKTVRCESDPDPESTDWEDLSENYIAPSSWCATLTTNNDTFSCGLLDGLNEKEYDFVGVLYNR